LRTEYVISEIEMNGYQLEVLEIRVANFDLETAETEMGLLLEEYGSSIEVVISNNDAMAIGAINTLVEEGYFVDTNSNGVIERETELWIPVIGIDGLPQSIDLIDRGYLYGTVINDSDSMAEVLVQLTKAILSGQDVNDIGYELTDGIYFWVDYQKYTKE
jgi:methyl-galactoside transport system substrate-binding protein